MTLRALLLLIGLTSVSAQGTDVPELKAIEARYDQTQFAKNEVLREKYILELAALRWKLSHNGKDGWEAVDAEILKHPAPSKPDAKALLKLRTGKWLSPRHDYLYRADGTWVMDPDDQDPEATHGTWTLTGNRYVTTVDSELKTVYVIILLDAHTFIYAEPDATTVFYESRPGKGRLPLRRDDP